MERPIGMKVCLEFTSLEAIALSPNLPVKNYHGLKSNRYLSRYMIRDSISELRTKDLCEGINLNS